VGTGTSLFQLYMGSKLIMGSKFRSGQRENYIFMNINCWYWISILRIRQMAISMYAFRIQNVIYIAYVHNIIHSLLYYNKIYINIVVYASWDTYFGSYFRLYCYLSAGLNVPICIGVLHCGFLVKRHYMK
jgi:hypothetical protein